MKFHVLPVAALLSSLGLMACTTVSTTVPVITPATSNPVSRPNSVPEGEFVAIENWTATIVTARELVKLGDVRGVSDSFNFEGRIYAQATLASRPGTYGGRPLFEVKWFNGDRLVSVQRAEYAVNKTPYYLVSSTSGTSVGAGKCHVELHANGKLLATRAFSVTSQ